MTPYIKATLLWKDRAIVSAADLAGALEDFRVDFVFHSRKMEGDDTVTRDLVRQVLDQGSGRNCIGSAGTLPALRCAAHAWELLLNAFDQRRPFSTGLLLDLYARLAPGGTEALDPHAADDLAQLEQLLGHVRRQSVLVAAAYLLAELEKRPPFTRANGPTARAMANYFLVLHDHPPVIFFEEDRRDYRSVINASDSEHHLAPLVRFLREELGKTWAEDIRRREEDETLWLDAPT